MVIRTATDMIIPTDMASTPSMVPGLTAVTTAAVMVAAIQLGSVCGRHMAGVCARCRFATECTRADNRAEDRALGVGSSAPVWDRDLSVFRYRAPRSSPQQAFTTNR